MDLLISYLHVLIKMSIVSEYDFARKQIIIAVFVRNAKFFEFFYNRSVYNIGIINKQFFQRLAPFGEITVRFVCDQDALENLRATQAPFAFGGFFRLFDELNGPGAGNDMMAGLLVEQAKDLPFMNQ